MNAAIDLVKAFAILLVLWQHTVHPGTTDDLAGNLWVRTAVPIFIALLGFNLMRSARKDGGAPWLRGGLRPYLRRRLRRIAVPFLLVLAAGYVIAAAQGDVPITQSTFAGGLPVNAPGNYFIPALIGLVVLFPLLGRLYERRPTATVLGCLAVNAAFDLVVLVALGWESSFARSLLFIGNPVHWLFAFALGMALAADPDLRAARNRWLLPGGAVGFAYLVFEHLEPGVNDLYPDTFLGVTNFAAAPWAALLLAAGLTFLPQRVTSRPGRALVLLGAASYHVYLVQMLVIGEVDDAAVGFALSIAAGIAYYACLPESLGGRRSERPAHRRWAGRPSTTTAR